jgi:large subunit ribosomal protein L13
MKTYSPKPQHIERRWYVVDAQGQTLGRMASEIAALLRGKHKPIFAPHMDTGDHVIVINAAGIVMTGGKEHKKVAYRHSGFPGGITGTGYAELLRDRPRFVVEKAVRGMLPKNRLGRAMFKKLHVVEGAEHPHQAQQPVPYTLGQPPAWEGIPEPAPRRTADAPDSAAAAPNRSAAKRSTSSKPDAKRAPASAPAAKKTTAKKPTAKNPTANKKTTATKRRAATQPPAAPEGEDA